MATMWDFFQINELASKCASRSEFHEKHPRAYKAALRRGLLEQVCSHMKYLHHPQYTDEELAALASQCKTRFEFKRRFLGAYKAASKRKILDSVCSHMPRDAQVGRHSHNFKWSLDNLRKYLIDNNITSRGQLCVGKHKKVHKAARQNGLMDILFEGVKKLTRDPYTKEELKEIALKYKFRVDFYRHDQSAYYSSIRNGILDEVCSHMGKPGNVSTSERELLDIVKKSYLSAKTLKHRKITIDGKPFIHGFDIDIFVPELRRGIEFDGIRFHSFEYMRSCFRKRLWPDEDLLNYHQIKDGYFLSKGIQILHIKEEDWIKDRQSCIERSINFLNTGVE